VSGPHPDDLPGTGSKTGEHGVSGITVFMIVPTLRVGMHGKTLCVPIDAERQSMHYHAERGNDQKTVGATEVAFHLARDLPGTGSKICVCGMSGITASSGFATAAR
jgi:hypothetical protein